LIRLLLRVTDADSQPSALITDLQHLDADIRQVDARALSGLAETVLAISFAVHSAVYLIDTLRRAFRRGLVIDAMGEELIIRGDDKLDRGIIVARSADGDLTIKDNAVLPNSLLRLLSKYDER
jgi:hypothetical protein